MIEVSTPPTMVPETLSIPTPLNRRYAIERELGAGAATSVYLARDLKGLRRVAVKVLRADVATNNGAERFLAQLPAAANLQHPSILPIIDFGRERGPSGEELVYCVSPYVAGGSLRQRLDRDPQLPLDEALRIAGAVAAALELAHRVHVCHRHIKPENILLQDGEALVDFGVGRSLAGVAPDWERDAEVLSRAASYLSPEELQACRDVGPAADQYSLAAVLYEMLAGQPPFAGPSLSAIGTRVLSEPPPRLTAIRVVPRIIERAINRALAKSPKDRFPTVGEFLAALHGGSVTPALPATPASAAKSARRRWRVALGASLVVLMIAAGVAAASRAVASRRTTSTSAHRQLTFAGTATAPSLSPDGRLLSYVAGGRSLVVQPLDGGRAAELLPSARRVSAARWTGDGRSIVVAMTRDSSERPATYIVSAAGGAARRIFDDVLPFDAGPDSTVILLVPRGAPRLEIMATDSSVPSRTIALPDSIGSIGEVDWSPDQRWIAFTDASTDELWVVSAAGGSPRRVAGQARRIRWAAASDALYFLVGPRGAVDLMRVGVNPQTGEGTSDATRVTSLLAADAFDVDVRRLVHTQTNVAAQARTFVVGGSPARVVEERPLSEGTAHVANPSVSPDGGWVAYSAARGAERNVHVVAFSGGSARVLAQSRAWEDAPTWSPDGTRLTFAREDSGGRRLVMADARTGVAQRVGPLPGPGASGGDARGEAAAHWSASNRHIAYYAQDLRRIAFVNLQRRTESILRIPDSVGTGHLHVLPSPNGTQLLASTVRPGDERPTLWLVFGNGRRWRRIRGPSGEITPIAWHRNGWIYLLRSRTLATDHGSVHRELWRMRGPTGRPELYAAVPEGCGMAVSISADATRGVCEYTRVESDLYVASGVGAVAR